MNIDIKSTTRFDIINRFSAVAVMQKEHCVVTRHILLFGQLYSALYIRYVGTVNHSSYSTLLPSS